jgi:MFS family permease
MVDDLVDPSQELATQASEQAQIDSWSQSVRSLMSNKNFKVFIITNWIMASLNVAGTFFNLYLRALGIDYIVLGLLFSSMTIVTLVGNLIASYLADNYNRRNLAIATMVFNGLGFLVLAFADRIELVVVGLLTLASSNFTGQGGTAYIYQVTDRKYGGVAVSLFTLGALFGLGPLFAMGIMFNSGWTFVLIMRVVFFIGAVSYLFTIIIRVIWLDSTPIPERERDSSIVQDFIKESLRGLKLLVRVFPVFILVMMIDALSDNMYNYSNLFYVNDTLDFNIGQIFLMMLITLAVSVPLTLLLGRSFDKRGGKRITIAVYSVMPIAMSLLLVAQNVKYIAPESWVMALDSIYPGLGVIVSLAFIATAMKTTNDNLWGTTMGAYIQKSLPRADLGKMLGLSTLLILIVGTFAPIFSGFIYTYYEGVPLIFGALILNIVILGILATKSIEPRVNIEELESELRSLGKQAKNAQPEDS